MRNSPAMLAMVMLIVGCAGPARPPGTQAVRPTSQPDEKAICRIAVVTTWGDLLAQPLVEVQPDPKLVQNQQPALVRVLLGIEAGACPRYGGVLVYALTEGYVPPDRIERKPSEVGEQPLGPLRMAIIRADEAPAHAQAVDMMMRDSESPGRDARLFVAPIMGARPGRLRVTIYDSANRAIAACEVTVTEQAVHPWAVFRPVARPADGPEQPRPGDPDDLTVDHVKPRGDGAAVPDWTQFGDWPLFTDVRARDGGVELRSDPELSAAQVSMNNSLPRFMPAEVDPGLKLSVRGADLEIVSREPIITARADWHFLVRWWVNGRPFVPGHLEASGDQNGVLIVGRHLRLPGAIDPAAIGARPGDRVGVQIMYCEHGWTFVTEHMEILKARHPAGLTPLPRLSNRAEFTVE